MSDPKEDHSNSSAASLTSTDTVKVSIIIPVFNGANFMREAIDSALAQTWHNIEVIVVNDGSSDDGKTDEIARSYCSRIKYISKINGGVASALNAGIRSMTGDVFCWLSHDDRYLPIKIAKQMAVWQERSRARIVLFSNYRLIDASGRKISDIELDHETLISKPLYPLLRGSIHGCSVFIPKAIFDDIGLFDVSLPTTQDYDLWHRMIRKYSFIHMPEVLLESRWHDEQVSKKIDHIVEATSFWKTVVSRVSPRERVQCEGNSTRFLNKMADFLANNRLTEAADFMRASADQELAATKVSVIIPVFNRVDLALSSFLSAAQQTHSNLEIIVVDDGSTENMDPLVDAIERHNGARLLRQVNQGPAAARNAGWEVATGEYVAFLDSDDLFLPEKIAAQLRSMAEAGAALSHTSYFRHWMHREGLIHVASGAANAFPSIIGSCGIATPTVMVRRDLWQEGFRFPVEFRFGEDVVLWLRIAKRHGIRSINRALTVVRVDDNSAAYDTSKQLTGVENILAIVDSDPDLSQHSSERSRLSKLRDSLRG